MSKKNLLILIIIFVAALGAGAFFMWPDGNSKEDEEAVKTVVEQFGKSMKNFSLLMPSVKEDLEKNYKDFVEPKLLEEWKSNPSKAVGRLGANPWPDKILISSIKNSGWGSYQVNGKIVMASGLKTEGEVEPTIVWPIDLTVKKINGNWLITAATTGEFGIEEI